MLGEDVSALGLTTARQLTEQATDDDDGFQMPVWVVITIIVLILTCLLCGCTCFVVRCFAPEVTQGAAWEINSDGTQWVKQINSGDDKPIVHSNSRDSYPGGIPVHNPVNDEYDPENPHLHRKPLYHDKKQALAPARQEVLDQLNGLRLAHGGGRLHANSEIRRKTAV